MTSTAVVLTCLAVAVLSCGGGGEAARRRVVNLRRAREPSPGHGPGPGPGHQDGSRSPNRTPLPTGPTGLTRPTGPTGLTRPLPRRTAGALPRRTAAALVGLAAAMVLGGWSGVMAGLLVGAAVEFGIRRLEPAERRRARVIRAGELPTVLDLLAVCLRAGMPMVGAEELVAAAFPGLLARDLRTSASLQRLGATAATAWSEQVDDEVLGAVARAVSRSAESGSRLADSLDRLAQDSRAEAANTAEARARKAGVYVMAPLGLCFLPAFICLGLVPVVISLATDALHHGTGLLAITASRLLTRR